jgi:hypothetical protein
VNVLGHRLLKLFLLALGAGYLLTAWYIPMDPWTAEELVNARTMPLIYGSLLVFTVLVSWQRTTAAVAPEAGGVLRMLGVVVLTLAFLLALQFLNLWFGLAALLAASAFWLGERRLLPIVALAGSVPLIGWMGIELLLNLHLPD